MADDLITKKITEVQNFSNGDLGTIIQVQGDEIGQTNVGTLKQDITNSVVSELTETGGVSLNLVNMKGVVPTYADLPTIDVNINDAYQVESDGLVYVYTESGFQADGDGFNVQPEPTGIVEEGNTQSVSGGEVFEKVVINEDLSFKTGKNIFDKEILVVGYIDGTNGNYNNIVSNYRRTSKIKIEKGNYFISGLGNIHYALGYRINDVNGDLLGYGYATTVDVTSGLINANYDGADTLEITIITTKPSDNTNINNVQIEKGNEATSYEPYAEYVEKIKDKKLTVTDVFTKENNLNSPVNIEFLRDNSVTNEDLSLIGGIGKNKFNYEDVLDGFYINPTNGDLTPTPGSSVYKVSPIIPIKEGESQNVSGLGNIHYALGYAFYNESGVKVANGASLQDVQNFTVIAPIGLNVKSWRFTVTTLKPSDNTNINNVQVELGSSATSFEPYEFGIEKIKSYKIVSENENVQIAKTSGLKLLLLGDSITTEDLGKINWCTYARPLLGITEFRNYARSGASFTDWTGTDNERQKLSVQIDQAIADGFVPDIIVISIGTNDYQRMSVLGDYDTAMGKATLSDLDRTKVLEAARYAFWKCKTQWGNAVCYYATPLQRALTPNGNESNNNGDWLRDPIARMANRYNWIVIDQYSESGVVKDFEVNGSAGRYLEDGLHPNNNGKILQSKFMANEIINKFPK